MKITGLHIGGIYLGLVQPFQGYLIAEKRAKNDQKCLKFLKLFLPFFCSSTQRSLI